MPGPLGNSKLSIPYKQSTAFSVSQIWTIMDHYSSVSCGIAAGVGITSHILYFVRGEHHQHTLQFLQVLFYGFFPLSFILARLLQVNYVEAMQLGVIVVGSYLIALWLSMLIYRYFFHRLKPFPGSRLARLSKFYQFFAGFRLNAFRRSHQAHLEYGNYVRTGRLILSLVLCIIYFFFSRGLNRCVIGSIATGSQKSLCHCIIVIL